MYHIYTLTDPKTEKVRYVGMSKNAHRRYAMHLLNMGRLDGQKDRWIKALAETGEAPSMSIIETVETETEARKREKDWIQHYLNLKMPLTNELLLESGMAPHTIYLGDNDRDLVDTIRQAYGLNTDADAIRLALTLTAKKRPRRRKEEQK